MSAKNDANNYRCELKDGTVVCIVSVKTNKSPVMLSDWLVQWIDQHRGGRIPHPHDEYYPLFDFRNDLTGTLVLFVDDALKVHWVSFDER